MTGLSEKLNPPARDVYRSTLRDTCFRLLNDVDMPGKLAQKGRTWLQSARREIPELERFKERILEVTQENRNSK
jgi:hypothetical protein